MITLSLLFLLQMRISRLRNSFSVCFSQLEKLSIYAEFFLFTITEFDPNLSFSQSNCCEFEMMLPKPSCYLRLNHRGMALHLLLADCDPIKEFFLCTSKWSKTSDDSILRSESSTSLIETCFISSLSKN